MDPNILFCGDNHGDFRNVIRAVRERRPDAVILLGDLQPRRPLHIELASILDLTELWWIHGNHDVDCEQDFDNVFGSELANRNLHGRVVEIAGRRVAGLGGNFQGSIWHPLTSPERKYESANDFLRTMGKGNRWRNGLPLSRRSAIWPDEYDELSRQRADILVTHEAPHCHPHGFEEITLLALSLGARVAVHGHHHDCLDYTSFSAQHGIRFVGVGLRGITDLAGRVLIPGEKDQARLHRQHLVRSEA